MNKHPELRNVSPDGFSPARNTHGMALVLTLMIVAIITAMVVEFAYGIYTNTASLSNWETSQQLSLAARSTVKLAARLIAEKAQQADTNGTFAISQAVPFGDLDTTVTLRIEDENAKFNLNSLVTPNGKLDTNGRPEQFVRLLQALKLPTSIADRVIDWIDSDSEPRLPGSEAGAKNAYLDSVDELLLIPGIDRKTYERLLPYVTIYGSAGTWGKININDASIPVLMSVPGVDEQMAERVVEYRNITPFTQEGNISNVAGFENQALPLGSYLTTGRSVFHVTATAESGGIKRTIDSVLEVSGISATVRYWKEM